jgi:putative copper export protein
VTEVGLIAARFVHYAALVLAFGAFAYAGYGAKSVSVGGRLGRLGLASSLLLLVATVAVLAATVAGLGGGFASIWDAMLWSAVVQDTGFGRVWSVRLVMALLLVALSVARVALARASADARRYSARRRARRDRRADRSRRGWGGCALDLFTGRPTQHTCSRRAVWLGRCRLCCSCSAGTRRV